MSETLFSPDGLLPGRAAVSVMFRGGALEGLAILCGLPIVFQTDIPHGHALANVSLVLGLLLLLVGTVVQLYGNRKAAKEKLAGYTTLLGEAKRDPSLVAVNPRSFRVVAEAHAPRPAKMPKA